MIDFDKYATKDELFRFLKDNRDKLINLKKKADKHADAVSFHVSSIIEGTESVIKASGNVHELLAKDSISVRSVINTTNLLDTAGDVHIPGLWKKSLKEQKNLLLLQEHRATFDHVISDEVKASAKKIAWKDLGFEYEGNTEALTFESNIEKARNPYMFEQYARGYVKNHSVGMRYVLMNLCINSDDRYYRLEKEEWEKYIADVANRDDAESKGWFWAVTEAKLIEGSAVLFGANWATPTQSVKEFAGPSDDTRKDTEPPKGAQNGMFSKFVNLKF